MPRQSPRRSFVAKSVAALLLILLADILFYGAEPGSTLGVMAFAWTVLLALARPAARRGYALYALGGAGVFAAMLVYSPSPLPTAMFWTSLATAALLPRRRFQDAASWVVRLAAHALAGPLRPLVDVARIRRARPSASRFSPVALVGLLAVPVLGSALFITLFAGANPLIGASLGAIALPSFSGVAGHALFAALVLSCIWSSFRPSVLPTRADTPRLAVAGLPQPGLASLLLSLVSFNLIFAVQNGLDLAFLWSGAPLPGSVTMADYAHRGAYMLIATALLAGLFVLVALQPGSDGARSPLARRLVTLWIGQNLLLVASSALRTIDYVEAYSLTVLRLSALIWMGLVAVGLGLICWRLLMSRSGTWLINANALAAGVVLTIVSAVDLGAVAAGWNVAHARELGRGGPPLDLCYLDRLGTSATSALIDLERASAPAPNLHDRASYLLAARRSELGLDLAAWRGWIWRDARRRDAIERSLAGRALTMRPAPGGRGCGGTIIPTLPSPPVPLTAEAIR